MARRIPPNAERPNSLCARRVEGLRWFAATSCVVLALGAPTLSAQVRGEEGEASTKVRANRLTSFLELPGKRREASRGLLRIGAPAVPALARRLRDPRPDVVLCSALILQMLGTQAQAARPEFQRLAESADRESAYIGRWGLAGIRDLGITTIVDKDKDRVIEFDAKGKEIRSIRLGEQIYDADRLPNGHYLVSLLQKGKVIEVDANGKTVWEYGGVSNPLDADRLPNGNTVIAGGKSKRVVEVDPDGKIVWEWKGSPWPNDADRLPSGNTLIADSPAKKIFEVDPAGNVVWELACPHGVIDVQRLPNGNTLFVQAFRKGVVEVNAEGKTVRTFAWGDARSIARRIDGATVLGGDQGVRFLDPSGKEVWTRDDVGKVNAVHVY